MTNEEKQQIKARFFGAHIGCAIKYSNAFGDGEYISAGVFMDGDGKWKTRMSDCGALRLDSCQLILRSLSSISDEEAIDCAKIYDADLTWEIYKRNQYFVQVKNSDLELFTIWFPIDDTSIITLIDVADNTLAFNQFEFIDYLRFLGFAIPFFGLDPIQEGWAVLESDKNSPKI